MDVEETPEGIDTGLGENAHVPVLELPIPSWPYVLEPQHQTDPSSRTAQVWPPPVATAVAVRPVGRLTGEGVDDPEDPLHPLRYDPLSQSVPMPNWPYVLEPQQYRLPSSIIEQTVEDWLP